MWLSATKTKSGCRLGIRLARLCFYLGYWNVFFFRQDIVEDLPVPDPIVYLAIFLLSQTMGTLLSVREIDRQMENCRRSAVRASQGIVRAGCYTVVFWCSTGKRSSSVRHPVGGRRSFRLSFVTKPPQAGPDQPVVLAILILM